jgi:hypothetical protein
VVTLDTCSDLLAYAELSAVPDWQGLGKRLGKDMGKVRGFQVLLAACGGGLASAFLAACLRQARRACVKRLACSCCCS